MTIKQVLFHRDDWVPNNLRLPVLIYRAILPNGGSSEFEATLQNMVGQEYGETGFLITSIIMLVPTRCWGPDAAALASFLAAPTVRP